MRRRPLLAALVLLPSTALAACPDPVGRWVPHAPMTVARQEVGAARIGDTVYVVGGLVAGLQATDVVEAYDVAADRWTTVAPLPAPRDHMAVAAVGGRLFVAGGFAGDFQARADVFAYDPGTNAWTPVAPMPAPRGGCWAVAHEERIYLFGGVDAAGVARATTLVYDPAADQWIEGAEMPTAREHLNAAAVGDFIYVIGGRVGGNSLRANERYDPATDTWQAMAPLPTARAAAAVAAFGDRIFVAGGETPLLFAVHEVYDVATDGWSNAAAMALPRHGIAAVALDDRILAPGGGTVQGLGPTNAVDAFIPPTTAPPPACPPAPDECREPARGGRAPLRLRAGRAPKRTVLVWDWRPGSATTAVEFGDPAAVDGYVLCLYDAGGRVLGASAPAGSACPGRTGWRAAAAGFRYRDPAGTPDGVRSIVLRAGGANGRPARIVVKAKGPRLTLPAPGALASPLTVQLRKSGAGPCWGARYSFPPADRAGATTFLDLAD